MKTGHTNLCMHAVDEKDLYKIWDDDLKNTIRRRQIYEVIGFLLLAAALLSFESGYHGAALYFGFFGLGSVYSALKFMSDESNVNYLLHQWDLREALSELRREARRRPDH